MIPAMGLVVVVAAGCSSTTCYLLRCGQFWLLAVLGMMLLGKGERGKRETIDNNI